MGEGHARDLHSRGGVPEFEDGPEVQAPRARAPSSVLLPGCDRGTDQQTLKIQRAQAECGFETGARRLPKQFNQSCVMCDNATLIIGQQYPVPVLLNESFDQFNLRFCVHGAASPGLFGAVCPQRCNRSRALYRRLIEPIQQFLLSVRKPALQH
jgi:hypothetical protein